MRRPDQRPDLRNGAASKGGRTDGFTLVEVMVALAIFSIAVLAHLHLQAENARTIVRLEDIAFAQIVAENRLAESLAASLPVEVGSNRGEVTLAGRNWAWVERVAPTQDPSMLTLEVEVSADGGESVIASVTGYRRAGL